MNGEQDKAKRERVFGIIAEQLGVPREDITERLSYLDDIAIDSLDVEELVLELEEEFGAD